MRRLGRARRRAREQRVGGQARARASPREHVRKDAGHERGRGERGDAEEEEEAHAALADGVGSERATAPLEQRGLRPARRSRRHRREPAALLWEPSVEQQRVGTEKDAKTSNGCRRGFFVATDQIYVRPVLTRKRRVIHPHSFIGKKRKSRDAAAPRCPRRVPLAALPSAAHSTPTPGAHAESRRYARASPVPRRDPEGPPRAIFRCDAPTRAPPLSGFRAFISARLDRP